MIVVGLLLAGAVGALLRYEVELHVRRRLGPEFPWGTLVINVTGAFVLGLLTGLADHRGVPGAVLTVVGTGLLGAFTTFSTFAFDTVGLAERGTARWCGGQRRSQPRARARRRRARPPGRRRPLTPGRRPVADQGVPSIAT